MYEETSNEMSELSSIYYVLWLRTKNNKLVVGYNSTTDFEEDNNGANIQKRDLSSGNWKLRMFVSLKKTWQILYKKREKKVLEVANNKKKLIFSTN